MPQNEISPTAMIRLRFLVIPLFYTLPGAYDFTRP
jgi:hypothetical protein